MEGNASAAVDGATEQRVDEDAWEDEVVQTLQELANVQVAEG